MKQFKRFIALLLIGTFLFSFSGCSFRLSSFDTLLRPPKAVGKYRGLQEAFEKVVQGDYILLSPESGKYKSAFLTYDFDSDGDEDAVVFYALKSNPDVARMWYFEYRDGDWISSSSVDGAGSSINMVMFSDIDLDKTYEIIVGWNLLSGKTNKSFVTYLFSDGNLTPLASYPYNYLTLIDVNGDGVDDIFSVYIDQSAPDTATGYARVYNFNTNTSTLDILSEAKTDGNVTGYTSVCSEKVDETNYIYIEATKGENESITELLYWDNSKKDNKLVAPLFDPESRTTKLTWRSINIVCMDIDADGFLEIPVSVTPKNTRVADSDSAYEETTEKMDFIKWMKFRNGRLKDVQYSIVNDKAGYVLKIPSSWVQRIVVKCSDGQVDVYRWLSSSDKTGDLLFGLYNYKTSDNENAEKYSGCTGLGVSGDTEFVFRVTDAGYNFGVKDENLEKNFILKDFG